MNPLGLIQAALNPMTLAQVAAGPAGWASLALQTLGPVVAQKVIQMAGERLGLPQPMIDMAQAAFAQATGQPGIARTNVREAVSGLAQQFDLSPRQQGELVRAGDQSVANMNRVLDGILKRMSGAGDEEGGSVLMKIARALGKLMDQKMDTLASKADQLGRVGGEKGMKITKGAGEGSFSAEGQSKFGELSAEVQALGQEIGYLSQAISSTIKSIGEAASTVARK